MRIVIKVMGIVKISVRRPPNGKICIPARVTKLR
jgi:hypothetical protein